MELDAPTFAIMSLFFVVAVAAFWDWYADIRDEADKEDEKYWEEIEPEDELDADRVRSGKK